MLHRSNIRNIDRHHVIMNLFLRNSINYPDYFALESVKKRLDGYDVSSNPDLLALADVMIMFCIRSAEVRSLRISDGG